jgi:D-amino-acid dehydrogenase
VIDRSPKSDRVIYAFGHGHLGLTQSAGTAQLVTQLVTDTQPDIPLSPYSATRF